MPEKIFNKLFLTKGAQTATELAIFGSILIFVVGVIVTQALSYGYSQNNSLKAMRMAMRLSFEHSEGFKRSGPCCSSNPGNASRNSANVVVVEDRLTAGAGKYSAVDRVPSISTASASHSRNLFYPIDDTVPYNLPILDMFINGQHFPLTTSAFRTINIDVTDATHPDHMPNCVTVETTLSLCLEDKDCSPLCPNFLVGNPSGNFGQGCEAECTEFDCDPDCPNFGDTPPCSTPLNIPLTQSTTYPCRRFLTIVANHPEIDKWCDGDTKLCPADGLSVDERFDLDRDGISDVVDCSVASPPEACRNDFSWQWLAVAGVEEKSEFSSGARFGFFGKGIKSTTNTLSKYDYFDLEDNSSFDLDSDLQEESVFVASVVDNETGVITQFRVLDSQEGDIDLSANDASDKPQQGLTNDVQMYSFVKDGTYLQIEEGKLFVNDGLTQQFVRNVQRKDQVDIIQRVIQLSRDTDRICNAAGQPTDPINDDGNTYPNPVEICCSGAAASGSCRDKNGSIGATDCFATGVRDLTCMDEGETTTSPIDDTAVPARYPRIFVRSRVEDLHGRKWVTDTSQDTYIDYAN